MGEARVIPVSNDDALAAAVAEAWISELAAAERAGRKHLVAVSGGRITKKLFGQFVEQSKARPQSTSPAEFFWADERCLSPDDAESNYRLANELLFQPLGIDSAHVHRVQGELSPEVAAKQASAELARIAAVDLPAIPVLDLVLLGMGEDGHVASLFPGDSATAADRSSIYLVVNNSPKPPLQRVSLGHAVIAAAREVWVLASGSGKQAALRESLSAGGRTPLAEVFRGRSLTRVYSDISLS